MECLAVLAIMGIIGLLLMPVFQTIRRNAKAIQCLSQTRQFGTAVLTYSAEHSGLPWWDGKGSASQTDGSTYPRFEVWARPYMGYSRAAGRLRCPLMRPQDQDINRFNYAGNGALCHFYPKLTGIPVPSSHVALVAECYYYEFFSYPSHFNMTMWGITEREAGQDTKTIKNAGETALAQNHGSKNAKGMHLFFLDGHAELVRPTESDWRNEPTYGTESNGGYFYTIKQFQTLGMR